MRELLEQHGGGRGDLVPGVRPGQILRGGVQDEGLGGTQAGVLLHWTARRGGRVLNDHLRLLVRIWLKIKIGRGMEPEQCGDYERSWVMLEDHAEDIMKDKENMLRSQYHLLGAVMSKEDMPDFDSFVSIYCKILINGIPLTSDR